MPGVLWHNYGVGIVTLLHCSVVEVVCHCFYMGVQEVPLPYDTTITHQIRLSPAEVELKSSMIASKPAYVMVHVT